MNDELRSKVVKAMQCDVLHSDFEKEDEKCFNRQVDRLMQLISAIRIEEVTNLGGATIHNSDAGGFCRKSGEQFRKCLQCLKDDRLASLRGKGEAE